MENNIDKEQAIRSIVYSAVKSYASGFSMRHLAEVGDENGVINMKIHNVFIAALGKEIQYYSALARSLDSSLGNMLEDMAISIAMLNYEVSQHVEGKLYKEQTDYIAELLEQYCILTNKLGSEENVKILFATAYNRYGEGKPWTQGKVRQFFSDDELCISRDFWNLVCKSERGYDIVIDEYRKNAHFINEALDEIKDAYLPEE